MSELNVGFKGVEWEVHKFGGTSVASAECFQRVAEIIEAQQKLNELESSQRRIAVVVSAMGGKPKTTDLLISTVKAASERKSEDVKAVLEMIQKKHFDCVDNLPLSQYITLDNEGNKVDAASLIKAKVQNDIKDIEDILKTVSLMKWQAERITELVSGYGEIWSTHILSLLLSYRALTSGGSKNSFAYIDARRIIVVDEDVVQDGAVCWDISQKNIDQVYDTEYKELENRQDSPLKMNLVITGYVASNTQGVSTTLQRDGSDYSASIVGRLLSASSVNIWTDVDGVLSADPRRVPTAFPLDEVSYNEAMELSYFGAKVIHPKTMQPAIQASPQIPIFIKNTFHPEASGTRIFTISTTHTNPERCVCGFSTIENMSLVNVEGAGMVGVKGVANRIFGALEVAGVNIVLISQASSEHTITFATHSSMAQVAKEAIEETFQREILQGVISPVGITGSCAIIAAVGDGMSNVSGVSGRFFSALGDAEINILAIAQGSSERNISAVVSMSESTRALCAVHAAFRLSNVIVRVGIIGMNDIGEALLDLLNRQKEKMIKAFDLEFHVCAIFPDPSGSEIVHLSHNSNKVNFITPEDYNELFSNVDGNKKGIIQRAKGDLTSFTGYLKSDDCANTVIFDCTADENVGAHHPEWLTSQINVITANNTCLSGPIELRSKLRDAESLFQNKKNATKYLREVTVGGALPVLNTLRGLLNSGDNIWRIEGIFSTSLSYIMYRCAPPPGCLDCEEFDKQFSNIESHGESFNDSGFFNHKEKCSFSQAVDEARALGLMEEDPLKDLSNEYTARCLMVIAKELAVDEDYNVEKIQLESDMLMVDVEKNAGGKGAIKRQTDDLETYEDIASHLDELIEARVKSAAEKGCVPRHISTIDVKRGTIDIKITDVPNTHVFATTPPSCECVRFFTANHGRFPLIIQGPSAGIHSTASGLLAELLRLMQSKAIAKSGDLVRTKSSIFLG